MPLKRFPRLKSSLAKHRTRHPIELQRPSSRSYVKSSNRYSKLHTRSSALSLWRKITANQLHLLASSCFSWLNAVEGKVFLRSKFWLSSIHSFKVYCSHVQLEAFSTGGPPILTVSLLQMLREPLQRSNSCNYGGAGRTSVLNWYVETEWLTTASPTSALACHIRYSWGKQRTFFFWPFRIGSLWESYRQAIKWLGSLLPPTCFITSSSAYSPEQLMSGFSYPRTHGRLVIYMFTGR